MGINQHCTKLCTKHLSEKDISDFKWMIERQYKANFVIDNLPALLKKNKSYDVEQSLEMGVPLGFEKVIIKRTCSFV
jgi:hypothetical protein